MSPRPLRIACASIAVFLPLGANGCDLFAPDRAMPPQTVALIATPKMIADFADPAPSVAAFLDNYAPLLERAATTIVVFAVGNSEHILTYRGLSFLQDSVEWARYTGLDVWSDRRLSYAQIVGIVRAFRDRAAERGIEILVFDQVDQGIEFTREYWKLNRHLECMDLDFEHSFDIRATVRPDTFTYASAPDGIVAGTNCGRFLVDQVSHYVTDLGFDGIMYGNQLGTRGRWEPHRGPGYSPGEAAAIEEFFAHSAATLGVKKLMWFDSYNNTTVERERFSVPPGSYRHFDYIIASGFCVITFEDRYVDNLLSKIRLRDQTRVLATLDYVDPWYSYRSVDDFPAESANLEQVAINRRTDIDGLVLFANDAHGRPVPRSRVESFASRFFR